MLLYGLQQIKAPPSTAAAVASGEEGFNPAETLLAAEKAAVASLASRAESLGVDPRRLPTELCRVACSVVEIGGQLWCMFFQHVQALLDSEKWEGVLIGTKRKYDETPHKVRSKHSKKTTVGASSGVSQDVSDTKSTTSKILQTEFTVFALLRRRADDKFILIVGRVPTWLQTLENCSGPSILAAQTAIESRIANLQQVASKFVLRLSLPVTDRHASNLWAEKQMCKAHEACDWKVWHNFCTVHRASTATKAGLSLVEGHISGVLSIGFCQQFGGTTAKLRKILEEIISERLVIRHGPPTCEEHRHFIYDLFLDPQVVTKRSQKTQSHLRWKQRFILNRFLNGNIQEDGVVTHWCMPLRSREAVLADMFAFVVPALVPHVCSTINRGSFLGHEAAIGWCGLLATHHNLLKPLICQFCNFKEQIQKVLPTKVAKSGGWARCVSQKSLLGRQADVGVADNQLQICELGLVEPVEQQQEKPVNDDCNISWQEMNKATRCKAAMYASSSPGSVLSALTVAIRPLQKLIMGYIYLSSRKWDSDQNRLSVNGRARSYRGLELFAGKQTEEFFAQVSELLLSSHSLLPMSAMTTSHQVLILRILSKGSSCVAMLLGDTNKRCPYALFGILIGLVDDVLAVPHCMRDSLTTWFLDTFKDAQALRSKTCQNIIQSVGTVMDVDILAIEARHSSSRRLVKLKSCQTWGLAFDQLSAEWTTRQQVCEDDRFRDPSHSPAAQPSRHRKKGRGRKLQKGRGGHGGPWRAYLHVKYSNRNPKSFSRLDFRKSAREYQNIKQNGGDDWLRLKELGEIATFAGRRKIKAFKNLGIAKNEASSSSQLAVSNASETSWVVPGFSDLLKGEVQRWRKLSANSRRDAAQESSLVVQTMTDFAAEIKPDLDFASSSEVAVPPPAFLATRATLGSADCVNMNVPVTTMSQERVGPDI